jgi:alpha-mannosidase
LKECNFWSFIDSTFKEAVQGTFEPVSVGQNFGPSWGTYWLKLNITIPNEWKGETVQLHFDPSCEAMIWSCHGEALQGITGGDGHDRHVDFELTCTAKGGEHVQLYIEVACNGMFGCGDYLIGPPDPNR